MQYIAIKKEQQNEKTIYIINAIPLKNTSNSIVQKIPHPLGSDTLTFETLEQAKNAITLAGFSYILPNGQKGSRTATAKPKDNTSQDENNYEQIVLNTIKEKINSQNSNVVASAILAISEFPNEETFDILFEKIGEDNDIIRKNAISGICRYSNLLDERIIKALNSPNWVVKNSALSCILQIAETQNVNIAKFLLPLTEACKDSNTIVQANALTTLAKVYQTYLKTKKI